ncbi:MAG: amino acid adenylation domain-containing protein [Ardenticatenaceae bacterium]|nr:amino acid adenylation domain-containing protein [Ardenticatenaceae bacterium]
MDRLLKETSRNYWQSVLNNSGLTAIPRWSHNSAPGTAKHEVTVADNLVTALRKIADDLDISLNAILLAAHAKVLAALSGESEVVTGYVALKGSQPLPCQLSTASDSWRTLLVKTHRAEAALLAHKAFPVGELKRELNLTDPLFETVFNPTGNSPDLAKETILRVNIWQQENRLHLQLHFRTEAVDADYAARIGDYHLKALALIAADPDADHWHQHLLSDNELDFLIEGLAGPHRELPSYSFHELFEQQVQAHPNDIAAIYADQEWTYRELNARANRLGQALLACGLRREGVVAVVTERNLDWMTAVLAIFKTGGVYLPVEPNFPADRIDAMLSRAECQIVLTEPGSTTTLKQALDGKPNVQVLHIPAVYEEDHAEDNLGIQVEPEQLAYIYFTSGSTGEPKGAMVEHAGMLNHLYAKIDDLEIGAEQVVAQIAPQCFDISLWQLVSALLVGGRTLIVKQEVILDVERFVNTIVDGRVSVMQVVPSYLEVVLSYLDQYPRELPDLRYVSVTGEALTKKLTQRWFAAMPAIKLVNAYGLTETSDDTNHEVMSRPPEGERVPLGSAINNVYIYVVDEYLLPVPLGAPGEIVFSGVCVGRGYINDPERTRLAYMPDPIRKGERLYRSGDYGRWRPDGKLDFLGRRDAQVKIRGFRIEIGDIENALLDVPGVRNGAVVVTVRSNHSKHLVGFYSGQQPLENDVLQGQLSQSLPAYMVPSIFHWQESLPLTGNGKINRKILRTLAGELKDVRTVSQPLRTPTEQRLAAAWAKVLNIPEQQLGRQDNFFDRGGTSLAAVRLAIRLNRAVSLKDVTRFPVLADLAGLMDGRTKRDSELLQVLAEPDGVPSGALVCFPYAGGNAVNFQPMATSLRHNGLCVHAVELPGHDLSAESELFAPLPQIVDQIVAEIIQRGLRQLLLWGHSSGAALAVATAKKLQERGVKVQRVFIGAQLLGDAAVRRADIAELVRRSDTDIAAELSADSGYTELGELDGQHAQHIGAAFRHDFVSASSYFADILDNPPEDKLEAPITVVVAADDPITAEFPQQYGRWQILAEKVDLFELAKGGHYFLRTHPAKAAQAVLHHAKSFTYPVTTA